VESRIPVFDFVTYGEIQVVGETGGLAKLVIFFLLWNVVFFT